MVTHMRRKNPMDYSEEETKQRMEAALRGARIAGHKPMESLTRKRRKAQPSKGKKSKAFGA
jgi:hypothetical protein